MHTVDQETLRARVLDEAQDQDGVAVLTFDREQALTEELGCPVREVELAALEAGVMPRRYLRNLGTVGLAGQARLLRASVGVVGTGGLGGYVIEGLARMGVGRLVLIDGDVFEDHNLNRQLLSTETSLGQAKAEVACRRVSEVNSAVEPVARAVLFGADNAAELLAGCDVIVDCLDRLTTRLVLQSAAEALEVPLVHGSIAGYLGQVMTILPGDPGVRGLYGDGEVPERGIEVQLGNPAATPMMVAAWQIQEVIKLLLGSGELLRRRLLFMDAESGTVSILQV